VKDIIFESGFCLLVTATKIYQIVQNIQLLHLELDGYLNVVNNDQYIIGIWLFNDW